MVSDITDLLLGVWSHFLSISLLVYFLSAQSRQEVYCKDWLQPYLHWCFSAILSSVITVFRLTAGNYCLSRLQPNIYTFSPCLSFLILRYNVVFGCLWGPFNFKMSAHLRYEKVNISLAPSVFWVMLYSSRDFHWLHTWRHAQDDESYHEIHALNTALSVAPMQDVFSMQGLGLPQKLNPYSSQFNRGEL